MPNINVADVGTENSERAGRCLRVRSAGISSQPFILKGSGSNYRPCSHLMDLLCAAELSCVSFNRKKKKIGNEEVVGRVLMRGVEVTQKQI